MHPYAIEALRHEREARYGEAIRAHLNPRPDFGTRFADKLFAGRKGHGGAPVSYLTLSRLELAEVLQAAFDAGSTDNASRP